MEPWLKVSCFLCVFGFLRELRPSEPYHADILLDESFNVTQDQVNREVYPIGTYSYLALLVVVFLVTDFLRYKPVIIANALSGIIIWSLLLWTSTLCGLTIVEIFYGFYQASEVAYLSYIYAKVAKNHYPRVTSHTRASQFFGRLIAGILAQALVTLKIMSFKELAYISVSSQVMAMVWACWLPTVHQSQYFHNQAKALTTATNRDELQPVQQNIKAVQLLLLHFRNAYTDLKVLHWSLWYALGFAGYLQVNTYMQVLWKSFENEPEISWNGAADAASTALAALFALISGYLHGSWLKSQSSLILLPVLSMLEGACILLACWTNNLYVSYAGYVLFGGFYGFTITVTSAELAQSLVEDSFALIFGINTLLALVLQTALTLLVISEWGLNYSTFGQFTVYGFYFIFIAIVYFFVAFVYLCLKRHEKKVVVMYN